MKRERWYKSRTFDDMDNLSLGLFRPIFYFYILLGILAMAIAAIFA